MLPQLRTFLDKNPRQIRGSLKVLQLRVVHPPPISLDGDTIMKIIGEATFRTVVERCQKQMGRLFDPYRPELHYMRGPGPMWREKHGLSEHAL